MRILVTGAAGFVGSKIIEYLKFEKENLEIIGIDNLSRVGSVYNLDKLDHLGCKFIKGDISDLVTVNQLPAVDFIIDCAADPSVLAGVNDGESLRVINSNLTATYYLLEKCKRDKAGIILLSTSRVYSIDMLNQLPLKIFGNKYDIDLSKELPIGCSYLGISEDFSTKPPLSLYGATKSCSEILALEYHHNFNVPVWINRSGVIAGPGQFGKIDQGVVSFWVYQYLLSKPLSFIGYGGKGFQTRDILHPYDVFRIILKQIFEPIKTSTRVVNIGGGRENSLSLFELNEFCKNKIESNLLVSSVVENRKLDIPYYVSDYTSAENIWNWKPTIQALDILDEIIEFSFNNRKFVESLYL